MTRTDLMTTAEVAEALRCSPDTVLRRVADGSLPSVRVGRRYLFARSAIERLAAVAAEGCA